MPDDAFLPAHGSGHRSPVPCDPVLEADRAAILEFLAGQRQCVVDILAGLSEDDVHTALLPSAWTPIGLVHHLACTELYWFLDIAAGHPPDYPWPASNAGDVDDWTVTPGRGWSEVLDFYRTACGAADEVIMRTPLARAPARREDSWPEDDVPDLRWIVLHIIEETARHVGQLDVWRELHDGVTGLAPR